jgi:hypothetical protein
VSKIFAELRILLYGETQTMTPTPETSESLLLRVRDPRIDRRGIALMQSIARSFIAWLAEPVGSTVMLRI